MSSELMKKISGQLTDMDDNALGQFPFGITIEFTRALSSDNAGGWIGSAPIKASGQFDLFTTYDLPVDESVNYKIFKDAQPITDGVAGIINFLTEIPIEDAIYEELKRPFDPEEEAPITISGRALNQNGKSVDGIVDIYAVTLLGRNHLETLNTVSGAYEYAITPEDSSGIQAEFSIPELTEPLQSDVFFDIKSSVVADFTVPVEGSANIPSEYNLLETSLGNAAGSTPLDSIPVENYKLLAGLAKENELLVKMFLLSYSFAQQVEVDADVYYGIIRHTMQESLEVIINLPSEELFNALKLAVNLNVIDFRDDTQINANVSTIKNGAKQVVLDTASLPLAESKGYKILSLVLSGTKLNAFLDYYYKNDTSDPGFWNKDTIKAAVSGISDTEVDAVKSAVCYAVLAGNNPAMVRKLLTYTLDQIMTLNWTTAINAVVSDTDFAFPDSIEGATTLEKTGNYADTLKSNFAGAFQTLSMKQSIIADTAGTFPTLKTNLASFLTANPTFDILRTPSGHLQQMGLPGGYAANFINEVATVQRLNTVFPSFNAIIAMKAAGISSASDVIQMPKNSFVTAFTTSMGGAAQAQVAYTNAISTVMATQAVASIGYSMVSLSIPSIYGTSPDAQANWRSLFGSVDFCTCSDCLSVFSPAAYLFDSLELLRIGDQDAYDQLRARRPDLMDIDLSCKNTNTALPYIDLVNEVLEDMVKSSLSDSNVGVDHYHYPITTHNTLLDEKTLDAIPEYIGTTTSPAYQYLLDAKYPWTAPYNYFHEQVNEYLGLINVPPYKLKQVFTSNKDAVYLDDINAACAYLNISGDTTAASEEYEIITDKVPGSGNPTPTLKEKLKTYYGVVNINGAEGIIDPSDRTNVIAVPSGSMADEAFLGRVDILMQQSGLSLADMLELLDCYYINPITGSTTTGGVTTATRRLSISAITGASETTCDTSKMKIENLTETDLFSMHRFVRLQRKTGWNKYELDQAFTALGIILNNDFDAGLLIKLAQLKRLAEVLKCSVVDILPFITDFGMRPYSNYKGEKPQKINTQYEVLFRNPLIMASDQAGDYPFPTITLQSNEWKAVITSANLTPTTKQFLLAALQISEQDFDTLTNLFNIANNPFEFDGTTGAFKFNNHNLTALYREIRLAKMLQLSVAEWFLVRTWMEDMNDYPFQFGASLDLTALFAFIDKVTLLRNSGSPINQLAYLFDDTVDNAAKGDKQNALFTQFKTLWTLLSKQTNAKQEKIDTNLLSSKLEEVLGVGPDSSDRDVDFMVKVVASLSKKDNSDDFYTFTTAEKTRFLNLLPDTLDTTAKINLAKSLVGGTYTTTPLAPTSNTDPYTIAEIDDRLQAIDDIYNQLYVQKIQRDQIKSALSTANKVDLTIADSILSKWLKIDGEDIYSVLLDSDFISGDGTPDVSKTNHKNALWMIERFGKAAALINAAKLSAPDIDFMLLNKEGLGIPDFADLPVGTTWDHAAITGPVDTQKWISLLEWLDIRKKFNPSPTGIFTVLQNVFALDNPQPVDIKTTWFNSMVIALQVNDTDLEQLVGKKDVVPSGTLNDNNSGKLRFDFSINHHPHLATLSYRQLLSCFDLQAELEANMESCITMTAAVNIAESQEEANAIVNPVKARFGNSEWLEQVKPVNDRLRMGRRDAMVAYLLAYPPKEYRQTWISSNDIFETLLLDTQMQPIVKTSRIKQAISSVQLFVDRCILQKEYLLGGNTLLSLPVEIITQWNTWRKWYRIWEANRRIFVYPENWIEPDLRDDKSPIFVELEKFIKQNDITADTMADAYYTYLERLDEVSHLDIVTYYTEPGSGDDTIVHVWGRTKSHPHIYYYRKRVAKVWTAWEKMDTQIDGDNFVAVKWRGKLRLYWLNLSEKALETASKIKVNEDAPPPKKYLKIELCWTELKNGKWLAKSVGKEWLETIPYGATDSGDLLYNNSHAFSWSSGMRLYTINAFNDSFDTLKESLVPYCRVNSNDDLEVIVIGSRKYVSPTDVNTNSAAVRQLKSEWQQTLNSYNNNDGNAWWLSFVNKDTPGNEDAVNKRVALVVNETDRVYTSFYKTEPYFKGRFTVKHNKIHADTVNIPNSFYNTLVESKPYTSNESQYQYNRHIGDGYAHPNGDLKLLSKAPEFSGAPSPVKSLVFNELIPSGASGSSLAFDRFFYKDYRNSFFVEKVSGSYTNLSAVSVSYPSEHISTTEVAIDATGILANVNFSSIEGFQTARVSPTIPYASLQNQATFSGSFVSEEAIYKPLNTNKYRFYPFYHYRVGDIMDQLDRNGLDGLFDWDFIQDMSSDDEVDFSTVYQPTSSVMHFYPASGSNPDDVYPKSNLDFRSDHPFAIYNWELFFHIPLLIANKLMQDQKFDEALKWFHYVFNPTNQSDTTQGDGPERFWQFLPFHAESLAGIQSIETIMDSPDLANAVAQWANNPFKPHLVARTRLSAYMKNVLMKYLDNLMAWGDQLFRRDTMESINEATLLYILAAQILGKPPVRVPKRFGTDDKSYRDMIDDPNANINAFSNALVAIETILAPSGVSQLYAPAPGSGTSLVPANMRYFCIPPNDKLLSYWDLVADRLFKIHNSQNIDGVERQLALFEPPIDPALLVRAAAAGVSLSDAVNDLFAPLPQYRFAVMQQKASEMVQEVKSLGASLLSAIEKKDAEQIALLRSSQEINVMDSMREIKQFQLQEAQTQVAALEDQRDNTTIRRDYYSGLIDQGLNANEQAQLDSLQLSIPLKINEGVSHSLASSLFAFPDLKIGSGFTFGATSGGTLLGNMTNAGAALIGVAATINDIKGSMAGIKGGYIRRKDDWSLQLKLANGELKQIEKQLVAAEIRASIAQKEIQVQELQFNNALSVDAAMRDKYSNVDLYDWMIGEISLTYFQCYKLAFDLAKRAEKCYSFELGVTPSTSFIQFGYWDSLKKGLLAGEGLAYDLKRMDASYMDLNKRQHEMTKHISLAALNPQALLNLKSDTRKANIEIPEWLFDMDYPGHYFRRIKSVSISIPCIAGPYSTVSAKLTLNNSKYRKTSIGGSGYAETSGNNDTRFEYLLGGGQSIATSSAQNDSGMFEMNFRDERYLPFEGAGTISNWTLELPSLYASFDRNSISDVIIHINYTAKYDKALTPGANGALTDLFEDTDDAILPRLFNVQQEFSAEWYAFLNAIQNGETNAVLSLPIQSSRFPIFCKGKSIRIKDMLFKGIKTDTGDESNIIIQKVPEIGSPTTLVTLNTGTYQALAEEVNLDINNQSSLKLKLSSSGTSDSGELLTRLKNLDALWLAAIYTI